MASIQFTGLGGGLDTASIINQLMAVETAPQNALKTRVAGENVKLSTMQNLNTSFQSLASSASSFLTGSTWKQLAATSSDANVTVAADATATATGFTVSVLSKATAAKISFADAHALTDVVADPASTLTLTLADGSTKSVDTGDGKFSTILANLVALKGTDGAALVNASSVNTGGGTYKLLIADAKTGSGSVSLTGANLAMGAVTSVAGSDASVDIGAGVTVTSRSNTFTDLVPGVDVTIGANATPTTVAQISVNADPASRSNAVKALIGQLNGVLTAISAATSYGDTSSATSGKGASGSGPMPGDSLVRGFAQQLLNTVFTGSGGVLNDMGVSIDRYGQFQFDATKFAAAYAKDSAGVQDAINGPTGFAKRVLTVARQISGKAGLQDDGSILSSNGQLSQIITQQQKSISRYNDQVAAWDDRLASRRATLSVIYKNLDTTLSRLNSQSSWLSSALEGLGGSSSSSK